MADRYAAAPGVDTLFWFLFPQSKGDRKDGYQPAVVPESPIFLFLFKYVVLVLGAWTGPRLLCSIVCIAYQTIDTIVSEPYPNQLNLPPPLPTMTNDLQRQLFGRSSPEPDQNRSEGNTTTQAQHESSTNRSVRSFPSHSSPRSCMALPLRLSGRAGPVLAQQTLKFPPSRRAPSVATPSTRCMTPESPSTRRGPASVTTSSSSSQPERAPAEDILRDLIDSPDSLKSAGAGSTPGKRPREPDADSIDDEPESKRDKLSDELDQMAQAAAGQPGSSAPGTPDRHVARDPAPAPDSGAAPSYFRSTLPVRPSQGRASPTGGNGANDGAQDAPRPGSSTSSGGETFRPSRSSGRNPRFDT